MPARIFLILGALFACLSVVFSAVIAHLSDFAGGRAFMVQTALGQQQFHALGLLLVGLACRGHAPSRWWLASGALMVVGMCLFSFNIYAHALLGFDALRALVPWGGGAWIVAWLLLLVGALRSSPARGGYDLH
ncbi:DUF423 domain-containing protein [Limnohabitans sp. T6-5]|uniref:DUF423 domain-containing protein n=1 Tax=Limnohabitans sp. T6-5 TaxID=1100724 RepID=UPI001304DCE8|nr:DUF423 domain-containing protein [Limnohabitans sp. T6-5]